MQPRHGQESPEPRARGARSPARAATLSTGAAVWRTALLGTVLWASHAARADDPSRAAPQDAAVAALVERLDHADPAVRRAAFDALRRRGPQVVAVLPASRTGRCPEQRRELALLRTAVREDWARSRTPGGMVYVPPGPVRLPREDRPLQGTGPGPDIAWLPGFYLDRTEVTVGAWRTWRAGLRLLGEEESLDALDEPASALAPDLPVTSVSREAAQRYAHDVCAGRLPTREEYLRAIRGAGVATWPWGPRFLQNHAHLEGDGLVEGPLPVGSLPRGAGPFGAEDLIGNVGEWSVTTLTRGGRALEQPLVWGGSWNARPDPVVAWGGRDIWVQRPTAAPRDAEVGFRVARAVDHLPVRDADEDAPGDAGK